MYLNLCLVFLISGFWHGAQWTFIFWGAYHGLFLVLDRLFLMKLTERIGKIPRIVLTFFITVIGWVFFRSETISQAFQFLKKMGSFSFGEFWLTPHQKTVLTLAVIISFFVPFFNFKKSGGGTDIIPLSLGRAACNVAIIVLILVICIGEISGSDFNPFIYFKF